jgi:hypothetical protein
VIAKSLLTTGFLRKVQKKHKRSGESGKKKCKKKKLR